MDIYPLDHSGFKLKGKVATVLAQTDKVTISHDSDEPFVINSPGEYEVCGVTAVGVTGDKNVIYMITIDGVRVCYLGEMGHKLTDEQTEVMGKVDILLMAVKTDELVTQLEPLIVIPTQPVEGVAPQPKLNITSEKLPETTTVICLQ